MRDEELDEYKKDKSGLSTDKSHDTSTYTESDGFLSIRADGFLGILERVPLGIKLCIMTLTSMLGMMILAALLLAVCGRDVRTAVQQFKFYELSKELGGLISAFQSEREITNQYVSGSSVSRMDVIRALNQSDAHYQKMMSHRSDKKLQTKDIQDKLDSISEYYSRLPGLRLYVLDKQTNVFNNSIFYREFMLLELDILELFSHAAGATPASVSYMYFLRLYELQQQTRSTGLNAYSQGVVTLNGHNALLQYINTRNYVLNMWLVTAHPEARDYYIREKNKLGTTLQQIETYIASNRNTYPSPLTQYDRQSWDVNTTALNGVMKQVETMLEDQILQETRKASIRSTTMIIVSVVVVALFFIISLVGSIVISYTIIGPWRRLNVIQEQAISKFVPQGFLVSTNNNHNHTITDSF
jgi:hypothetical protein